jgi:electron transport complex protein RnfG
MACGFAIAVVYEATAGPIARNRTELLEQSVAQVLPGAKQFQGYDFAGDELTATAIDRATLVAGYDDTGFIGVALPASIMGYQDSIRMLLGYDPHNQQLTGFAVLESRETPGLGSKIATDEAFLDSLHTLDVTVDAKRLINPVTLATRGSDRTRYQVDGITGATVSSRAVVAAINGAAPQLAAIRGHLQALRDTIPEDE